METDAHDNIKQSVADHLEVEVDDLEVIENTESAYTFRQASTGEIHTAQVSVGPEGPVVTVDEA